MNYLPEKVKKILPFIFILIALTIASIFTYKDTIQLFPSYVHSWTQSDRYAIVLRYSHSNLNFFHPQTYNLKTKDAVTSVDFPLSDYIPGVIMKLFNFREPIICRMWALLISILGLSFLFSFVKKQTQSLGKALLVVFFIFTAPVYTYYQAGFLPSIHSFATAIIGYCFFFKYLKSKKYNELLFAALFFGLAALMRLPFVIFIVASAIQLAYNELKSKNKNYQFFIPHVLAIGLVVIYFLFNKYLTHKFGTMFLTKLLPISGSDKLLEILTAIRERWIFEYFTLTHYIILLLFVVFYIVFKRLKRTENNELVNQILFQAMISAGGAFAYFIAMGNQFIDHDYYFIDSFFLPLILLFIALIIAFPVISKNHKIIFIVFSLALSFLMLHETINKQKDRYTIKPWDITEVYNKKFEKAKILLDELKISKNAKILIMDSYTSNIPLIRLERQGYCIMNTLPDSIKKALTFDYDYMVVPRSSLFQIYTTYPDISKQIKYIGRNGNIAIYQKSKELLEQNYGDLLGLNKNDCVLSSINNFESSTLNYWQNINQLDSSLSFEGKKSQHFNENFEFSATFKGSIKELGLTGREFVTIENNYYLNMLLPNSIQLIVSLQDSVGKTYFYKNLSIDKVVKETKKWNKVLLTLTLPDFYSQNDILGIYTWNSGKQDFYLDNSKINFYNTGGNLYEVFPENFNYYFSVN